jgi:hypothetical protein
LTFGLDAIILEEKVGGSTAKRRTTMEIKQSYLMWVGSEHYKSIEDWTGEAVTQGISKRLPNADVGQALTQEGTVIFVAHDEGEFHECSDCLGTIENPEKRKLKQALHNLNNEIADLAKQTNEIQDSINKGVCDAEGGQADIERIHKLIERRSKKALKLQGEVSGMPDQVEGGTGGQVHVSNGEGLSTERWDYRKYNYWLHQPKRFNADNVLDKEMCETCGGTGRLPDAKVFGLFLPDAVEYILKAEDTEAVKEQMEKDRGFQTVSESVVKLEKKRKCGIRHPGGVYVVTDVRKGTGPSKSAKEVVEQLVADEIISPEGIEINGSFVRFLNPIDVDVKRFRGIKRWSLDPRAEDEAEMILEAIA